jgi:NADPH:quinone reductase
MAFAQILLDGRTIICASHQRWVSRGGEYLNKVPGSAALFSAGLGQLVSLGLKPTAPQHYPLSEAQAALQCAVDGGVLGKLVLEP